MTPREFKIKANQTGKTQVIHREIDALVAEKVMGERVRKCSPGESFPPDGDWMENRGWTSSDFAIIKTTSGWRYDLALPHYSTDLSAAWGAVEKIGLSHEVTIKTGGRPRKGWKNSTEVTIGGETSKADTAPLAICLAALKAIGARVE